MIEVRKFSTLGGADHGWLDAKHHFSFAGYQDMARMNWGSLRVWNDDTIQPKTGFPPHPHSNMEIITYVREGAITHRDNLGNEGRTVAGDVQVMSAGTGIRHSEYNLEDEVTRIFQIWIIPDREGERPSWGSMQFPKGERAGAFVTLASGIAGDAGALPIRADARVVGAALRKGETVTYKLAEGRNAYLVPATGQIEVNGAVADERDGVAVREEAEITITARSDSEIVLVDAA